jgi:hypothetical protein
MYYFLLYISHLYFSLFSFIPNGNACIYKNQFDRVTLIFITVQELKHDTNSLLVVILSS